MNNQERARQTHSETKSQQIDPVCGMAVSPETATAVVEQDRRKYYFCSDSCKQKFLRNSGAYLSKGMQDPASSAPGSQDADYTCPMHPEIVRSGPGICPICGMALEPRTITVEGDDTELQDMSRRFWISTALTVPILAFMVSEMVPSHPLRRLLGAETLLWVQFALATPIVLWGGWPFFYRGWLSLKNRSLNMFTLIALGTGAAYLYSVFALLFPGWIPGSFRSMGGDLAVYFEPAAVIVTLVLLGQVLELRARSQTSSAIKSLLGLAPKTARVLQADGT